MLQAHSWSTRAAASGIVLAFATGAVGVGAARSQSAAVESATPMAMLSSLQVRAERPAGYDRALFEHWVDQDGDGCDTRREVIISESRKIPQVTDGCWIGRGMWVSLYDGQKRYSYPSDFDVDHLVPLAEAWRSGAHAWNDAKRADFANDLRHPESLIAVSEATNRSKSDKGPEAWLPPRRQVRCGYAADWVRVKYAWGLSVDSREKRTLARILRNCPAGATLVQY